MPSKADCRALSTCKYWLPDCLVKYLLTFAATLASLMTPSWVNMCSTPGFSPGQWHKEGLHGGCGFCFGPSNSPSATLSAMSSSLQLPVWAAKKRLLKEGAVTVPAVTAGSFNPSHTIHICGRPKSVSRHGVLGVANGWGLGLRDPCTLAAFSA